MIIFY